MEFTSLHLSCIFPNYSTLFLGSLWCLSVGFSSRSSTFLFLISCASIQVQSVDSHYISLCPDSRLSLLIAHTLFVFFSLPFWIYELFVWNFLLFDVTWVFYQQLSNQFVIMWEVMCQSWTQTGQLVTCSVVICPKTSCLVIVKTNISQRFHWGTEAHWRRVGRTWQSWHGWIPRYQRGTAVCCALLLIWAFKWLFAKYWHLLFTWVSRWNENVDRR